MHDDLLGERSGVEDGPNDVRSKVKLSRLNTRFRFSAFSKVVTGNRRDTGALYSQRGIPRLVTPPR